MTSMIYFTGENFDSIHRIQNIRNKVNSQQPYEMITIHDKWVEFLENNTEKNDQCTKRQIEKTFHKVTSTKHANEQLQKMCKNK